MENVKWQTMKEVERGGWMRWNEEDDNINVGGYDKDRREKKSCLLLNKIYNFNKL